MSLPLGQLERGAPLHRARAREGGARTYHRATAKLTMNCLAPAEHVWPAAAAPRALHRLLSDCSLRVQSDGMLRVGSPLDWSFGNAFPRLDCRTRLRHLEPGKGFVAVRVGGSFPAWVHERRLVSQGDMCSIEDRVTYETPGWLLARWVDERFVRQPLLELMLSCLRATAGLATCRTTEPLGEWLPEAVGT